MEPVYTPVVGTALALFRIMDWKVGVTGAGHIPRRGGAVVASNHISYLDFIFVGAGARKSGRLVRFMAKREIFDHRITGPLMRGMKHIAVDRHGNPEAGMGAARRHLQAGEVVGMFPEGTISRSFVPMAGKTGAARLAIDEEVPLIPCGIWGPHRMFTKGRPRAFKRGVDVSVAFGPPVPAPAGADARAVTVELMAAIGDLVETAARDYAQRPADGEDAWWVPAHLGGTAPTPEAVVQLMAEERARERARRSGVDTDGS